MDRPTHFDDELLEGDMAFTIDDEQAVRLATTKKRKSKAKRKQVRKARRRNRK